MLFNGNVPADKVVVSIPSVGLESLNGDGVVNGVLGKLSNGASGCRMSYRNSGIMGTVKLNIQHFEFFGSIKHK